MKQVCISCDLGTGRVPDEVDKRRPLAIIII
jgi:hypothetical protein